MPATTLSLEEGNGGITWEKWNNLLLSSLHLKDTFSDKLKQQAKKKKSKATTAALWVSVGVSWSELMFAPLYDLSASGFGQEMTCGDGLGFPSVPCVVTTLDPVRMCSTVSITVTSAVDFPGNWFLLLVHFYVRGCRGTAC